jgi:hypothetical protein
MKDRYSAFIVLFPEIGIKFCASALSFMLENFDKTVIVSSTVVIPLKFVEKYSIPEVITINDGEVFRGNSWKKLGEIKGSPKLIKKSVLKRNKDPFKLYTLRPDAKIVIVKSFPGINQNYLRDYVAGSSGVIIEPNVPENIRDYARELSASGVVVVDMSQHNIPTECAFAKLLFLLSNVPTKHHANIPRLLKMSMRGELV